MFRFAQRGAIRYLEAEEIAALDLVTHAFCTRLGGVSEGPFSSLNTGFLVGDREEDVRRNLTLIADSFSIPANRLVLMRQVHGDRILILDEDGPPPGCIPACDGLITDRPGVALGIKTADCVPLLFVDPVRRVIGVAHAGWRGTTLRIASRMVDLFEGRFASRVENILIAVGPTIGVCCYQVDAPVYATFSSRPGTDIFLHPCPEEGRWMLDLASANHNELMERGVPAKNILSTGYCTACRRDIFFSHRASLGCTGRQINLLMLRDDHR
jgi:YfiH family protein